MAAMSSTGTTTWSSSGLRAPASTMATSRSAPIPPRKRAIVSSGRCVADSPIRWMGGGAAAVASAGAAAWAPFVLVDAVARPGSQRLEPLEAEREVRAALRAGDRVDLVDDDVLDVAEDLARGAGEHQVQRLGRRDQDVGRVPGDLAPVLGRRVARPAGDRDVRRLVAHPRGRQGDPGQRRPEVALDVVGQRLERRDVQDADRAGRLAGRRRPRVGRQPVQAPQERGEGLAAPRRGVDQRVPAARRWRPSRGPARRSAPRSWPGTSHGRRARRARADRRRREAQPRAPSVPRRGHFDQMFGSVRCQTARARRAEWPVGGAATWPYRGHAAERFNAIDTIDREGRMVRPEDRKGRHTR